MRKPHNSTTIDPFLVVVCFPSSSKEYTYLCNLNVMQGDEVIANNTKVRIIRTAPIDHTRLCTSHMKWVGKVPTEAEIHRDVRKKQIEARLNEINRERLQQELFIATARFSPEARKLIAEYKKLK